MDGRVTLGAGAQREAHTSDGTRRPPRALLRQASACVYAWRPEAAAWANLMDNDHPPAVAVLTLGCPKNLVDSEHIASLLEAAGVEVVTDAALAPVAIVNTCGFIDPAKAESIDAILDVAELKESGSLKTLIVAGCLSERYGEELRREIPEADVLLGVDPRGAARAALKALGLTSPLPSRCDLRARRLTPRAWTYLRIAEGCNNRCAYCVIPSIRGPLTSRPERDVIAEARALLHSGVREINVIAQDTTAYGMDSAATQRLHVLLRRLCRLKPDKWVRLLYTHPAHYYPELLDILAAEEQICPYLDIPLQHISGRILRRMGRKVTRGEVEGLIEALRARIPGLALRTTFMVGFPGETDEDFEQLLEFVAQVRFDRVGAFTYSREEGTQSAAFKDQVPERVKRERLDELMTLQKEIAADLAAARVGERTVVLVEREAAPGQPAFGRSPREAPDVDPVIFLEGGAGLRHGEMVEVEIVCSAGYDCIARPLGERRGNEA